MILITGAAVFIGYHLSKRLLELGYRVYGIDNLNDYYDISLKTSRLDALTTFTNFHFKKLDLVDQAGLKALFKNISLIMWCILLLKQACDIPSLTQKPTLRVISWALYMS